MKRKKEVVDKIKAKPPHQEVADISKRHKVEVDSDNVNFDLNALDESANDTCEEIARISNLTPTSLSTASSTTVTPSNSSAENVSSSASNSSTSRDSFYKKMTMFNIKWNKALNVPQQLKKLQKYRLNLSQEEFSRFSTQLYQANCVAIKASKTYIEPTTMNMFPNLVYIRAQRYLTFENCLKLYIWKYFNEQEAVPSRALKTFLDTPLVNEDGTLLEIEAVAKAIKGDESVEKGSAEKAGTIKKETSFQEKIMDMVAHDDSVNQNYKFDFETNEETNNGPAKAQKQKYEFDDQCNLSTQVNHDVGKGDRDALDIVKETSLKINEQHTIQRCFWTVYQRSAMRNTRDYWLRGFKKKYPMLSDLPFNHKNNKVRLDFFLGLLKANVPSRTLCEICLAQVNIAVQAFEDLEASDRVYYGSADDEFSAIDRTHDVHLNMAETTLKKEKIVSTAQRTSITNFDPIERDINACITIQKFYRRRLQKLKRAVQIIEIWWEPMRVEGEQIRRLSQIRIEEMIDQANASDALKYDDYVQELKAEYYYALNLKKHDDENDADASDTHTVTREVTKTYWLQVLFIVIGCTGFAFVLQLLLSDELYPQGGLWSIIIVVYGLLHLLTAYRLRFTVVWIQTVLMLILLSVALNTSDALLYGLNSMYGISGFRIVVILLLYIISQKYWLITFWVLTAILYVSFFNVIASSIVQNLMYTLHDFYLLTTIAGASGRGKPIQLVHKMLTNWLFVIFALVVTSFHCIWGRVCGGGQGVDDLNIV